MSDARVKRRIIARANSPYGRVHSSVRFATERATAQRVSNVCRIATALDTITRLGDLNPHGWIWIFRRSRNCGNVYRPHAIASKHPSSRRPCLRKRRLCVWRSNINGATSSSSSSSQRRRSSNKVMEKMKTQKKLWQNRTFRGAPFGSLAACANNSRNACVLANAWPEYQSGDVLLVRLYHFQWRILLTITSLVNLLYSAFTRWRDKREPRRRCFRKKQTILS